MTLSAKTRALPAAALALLIGAAFAEDEAAKLAFNNNCRTCHVTDEGDHRLGPILHSVVGRQAGEASGYGYSAAMADSDVVWDAETLARFIENPDAVVPGNNMKPYSGIASEEARARIVDILEAESASR